MTKLGIIFCIISLLAFSGCSCSWSHEPVTYFVEGSFIGKDCHDKSSRNTAYLDVSKISEEEFISANGVDVVKDINGGDNPYIRLSFKIYDFDSNSFIDKHFHNLKHHFQEMISSYYDDQKMTIAAYEYEEVSQNEFRSFYNISYKVDGSDVEHHYWEFQKSYEEMGGEPIEEGIFMGGSDYAYNKYKYGGARLIINKITEDAYNEAEGLNVLKDDRLETPTYYQLVLEIWNNNRITYNNNNYEFYNLNNLCFINRYNATFASDNGFVFEIHTEESNYFYKLMITDLTWELGKRA